MLFNDYKDNLLDKPSVVQRWCPVCSDRATDEHHVVQKGMGGVSSETEKRIPKIKLCRNCHARAHSKHLHFQWADKWLYFESGQPMSDQHAWELFGRHYSPLKIDTVEHVFGGKNA